MRRRRVRRPSRALNALVTSPNCARAPTLWRADAYGRSAGKAAGHPRAHLQLAAAAAGAAAAAAAAGAAAAGGVQTCHHPSAHVAAGHPRPLSST